MEGQLYGYCRTEQHYHGGFCRELVDINLAGRRWEREQKYNQVCYLLVSVLSLLIGCIESVLPWGLKHGLSTLSVTILATLAPSWAIVSQALSDMPWPSHRPKTSPFKEIRSLGIRPSSAHEGQTVAPPTPLRRVAPLSCRLQI